MKEPMSERQKGINLMRDQRMLIMVVAGWIMVLSGCLGSGGSLPDIPIPTLTPIPQPFRTGTTFVDGVLSVDVRSPDGRTRTLNAARHMERSWGLYLPRPVQPNFSSREWLLSENHYDGRIMVYVAASWNDADETDYLAGGWWLIYPPGVPYTDFDSATRGIFADGPELDLARPPDLPLTGTATYVGGMSGLYTYHYGRAWGELAETSEFTEFVGRMSLTADFDQNRLTGCLGCDGSIETAAGRYLYPLVPWQGDDPEALPTDYELHFASSFGANGTFEDTAITVTHSERTITNAAGTWQGQFSNVPDVDGNPRRVVGSTDVHFAEDDGSQGQFTGFFDALTPATLTPPGGRAGNTE